MERPGLEYDCTFPEDVGAIHPVVPCIGGVSIVPKIRGSFESMYSQNTSRIGQTFHDCLSR